MYTLKHLNKSRIWRHYAFPIFLLATTVAIDNATMNVSNPNGQYALLHFLSASLCLCWNLFNVLTIHNLL